MTPAKKSAATVPDAPAAPDRNADIAELNYESARDELVTIVGRLEGGQVGLEESMRLWERGEALADHCAAWLDGAERRLRHEESDGSPGTAASAAPARGAAGPGGDTDAGYDPDETGD